MNPMMRAMTAHLAKAVPALSGAASAMSGMNGTEFGVGGLVPHAPDGRSWAQLLQPNAGVSGTADATGKSDRTQLSPVDRIKQAWDAIHSNNLVPANSAGVFGPDAVMTGGPAAPGPMNLASHGMVNVPDRPNGSPAVDPAVTQGAPVNDSSISFFLRNALAQRDQESGQYLNPTVGAQAMASPFKGLFG